jgi:hypothetical protein
VSIALELGVREFRSLRREGGRLIGRSCPSVYVVLPQEPAERRLLDQARIAYSACRGSLLVIGPPALELARSLKLPCLTPFENNRLAPGDAIARQVSAALIEAVLPPRSATMPATRCMMTAPGQYGRDQSAARSLRTQFRESSLAMPDVSTAATLAQFVRLQGYAPSVLSASYAVGLAELGHESLTGLALHLGAGECQASLLQQGRELIHAGIPRGEDSLIDQWARLRSRFVWDHEGHCYLHQFAVREWKEQTQPSLEHPGDDDARVWKGLVADLLAELLSVFDTELARAPKVLKAKTRLPVVYAGSLADSVGFSTLLQQMFASSSCQIPAIDVRRANDPQSATLRGLLIYAEGMAENGVEIERPLSHVG